MSEQRHPSRLIHSGLFETFGWILLAAIHASPAFAVVMPSLITRLYGVDDASAVFVLLHHRAALFAVILFICVWALFRPEVRRLAAVAVGFSMISFLVLYGAADMPENLRVIAIADLIGLIPLGFVSWRAFRPQR